ncbi:MAG: N(4)-(beta-N-acetylglucosaminyl)-L-asparaginase [Bacteroidales bacterium]|nr:N(4)-(beta-N-acetylglucosaminyl)-L-asparaginase [Bacteroidales bacterium]
MKINRRNFIAKSILATAGTLISSKYTFAKEPLKLTGKKNKPVVIATWDHGFDANKVAWKILSKKGRALDAVEKGVMLTEADADNLTVGLGGLPDRDGYVTLDASIMDEKGNAGSVSFLQHIVHPISVARLVMEKTPHVMLSGEGALQFALANGFKKENLLTEKAKQKWKEWKKEAKYEPVINIENHDTIGMVAIDAHGNLSSACTTSGLAYKMHGRVGDSPIIGAGMYVDNEVGAAVATGMGELVMKTLGSFLIVEFMRNGLSPQQACEKAIERIKQKLPDYKNFQIGYLAINKSGETGAYSIQKGFNYAKYDKKGNRLIDADYLLK